MKRFINSATNPDSEPAEKAGRGSPLPRLVVPLPCPFCGCKPKIEIRRDRWAYKSYLVTCKGTICAVNPRSHPCSLAGKKLTRAEAITAWNTRHNV